MWALPFLTALEPSERYHAVRGRRHKTLLDFGRQLALQARRWLPGRDLVHLVLVADSSFSSLLFLSALQRHGFTTITRLRLDAALHDWLLLALPAAGRLSPAYDGVQHLPQFSG